MAKLVGVTTDRLADYFVSYLFDRYKGTKHVRRVASWVGFIVIGIDRVASTNKWIPRERQLQFQYRGRTFKTKYNHKIGSRGGIEIIEVLPGKGSPEGKTVTQFTSLEDAAEFFNDSKKLMADFVRNN